MTILCATPRTFLLKLLAEGLSRATSVRGGLRAAEGRGQWLAASQLALCVHGACPAMFSTGGKKLP